MSYKDEMEALIIELRELSNKAKSDKRRELKHRQAEVLDFLIHHPDDALGILKRGD
jgi:hypothetical protein